MEMRRQAARRWRKVSNAIRTCNRLGRFTCVRRPRSASYVAITHYDAEAATSFLAANDEHFKGLVREKSLACFHHLGGAATIASRLGSDCERGINPGDLSRSKEEFGENVYPMPGPKSFFAHVRDTIDVFLAKDSTIILDGKFDTVVTTIWLGRRVYNSIQRVVQFQLTFIVVLTVVSFVTPITTGRLPLTTVEIFMWHLVMVVMNTLAVVADKQPAQALMDDRPPIARVAPLVSNVMWRNMAAQAAFQIGTLLALQYNGRHVFSTDGKTNDTIIFTVFVLCQVFNQLNVRELEKKNVFAGVLRSWIFLVILALTLALLVVTVEVLTRFAGAQRLGLWHWGICVAIAALSLPVGCAPKFIPVPAGRRP